VGRVLAQKQQQRRLGKALDPGENAPAATVVAAGARSPHSAATCKTHM
jgi:hypothetical protein